MDNCTTHSGVANYKLQEMLGISHNHTTNQDWWDTKTQTRTITRTIKFTDTQEHKDLCGSPQTNQQYYKYMVLGQPTKTMKIPTKTKLTPKFGSTLVYSWICNQGVSHRYTTTNYFACSLNKSKLHCYRWATRNETCQHRKTPNNFIANVIDWL